MSLKLVDSIQVFVNHRLSGSVTDQETSSRPDLALTALSGGAFLTLVVYCVLGSVMITVGGAKSISNQNENTYPENAVIYTAVHAAQTGHLYSSPSQPPYVLQPFGPFYYLINAMIARASHFDFGLIRTSARLLTYSCFLLSAFIVFLICRRLRFSAVIAALAALMFLGQPSFLLWNVTARPDMLFLTAMLLSLLLAVEGDTLGVTGYLLSGTLAGVAFLIKQPGVAAPLAVLTILLCRKKFRPAAVYALSAGLPVVLVLGGLLWHKGPFVEQFTSVGQGFWSLHQGALFARDQVSNITMLVPILIGAIGFAQAIRGDMASQMIAAFALANWAVGLSGLPQLGSNVNYFLPGLAGCALLLPFTVQVIRRNLSWKVAYAVIIVGLVWTTTKEVSLVSWALSPQLQQLENPYVALAPFKILSDRSIFTLSGRDADLLDPYTAHELELGRHWDSSPIIEKVRRGDYDLVILAGNGNWHVISHYRGVSYFSPVLVKAINENYSVLCSTLNSAVLMPRKQGVEAAPAMLGLVLGAPCGLGSHGRAPNLMVSPDAN